jgi:multidrug efflux pump subunit AcrB
MQDDTTKNQPDKKPKSSKEFGLTSMSVDNKTTVFVITAIILLAGLFSYISMPKEAFPEVVIPEIYVGTPYPGNSPMDIEKLITRPFEKEINTISGIDELNSTSIQGYSSIQVKFDFSVTPEEALRKVKDKVDVAMSDGDFPDDLPADPNVFEMNISELTPIMTINLSGEFSLDQLKEYGEHLEEEIEDLPQITSVDIRCVMDKEVKVDLDMHKMDAVQVSFGDVAGAISQENLTISGGDLKVGNYERSVRVLGEFKHWSEIENIIVKHEKGNIVYLRDIGTVDFGEEDKESFARQFLEPVVSLDVKKRSGANLIEASDAINIIVEEAQSTVFPKNLEISITNDQSDDTRTQVDELANSIIFGMILVVGTLLFFLGLRNALFVGMAIPMSMFLSFFILNSMGVTLNVMVLFSLVLALGMLVDNGIVVVENIYRLMDEGYKPLAAAKEGVGEVAWPIIASTATTLAAFIPLIFWPGIMGEFMQWLPITLITVLASSLFVALVINPVFTSNFMKIEEEDEIISRKRLITYFVILGVAMLIDVAGDASSALNFLAGFVVSIILILFLKDYSFIAEETDRKRVLIPAFSLIVTGLVYFVIGQNVSANFIGITGSFLLLNTYVLYPASVGFQKKVIPAMENFYDRFIRFSLSGSKPGWLLFGTFGLLIFSFILTGVFQPKVLFFPENQPKYLNIFIEMPIGTAIERTNEVAIEIEKTVIDYIKKYEEENPKTNATENFLVESVIGQVGEGTSDPNQGPQMGNTPHKARITVSFVKFQERRGTMTSDVQSEVREAIKRFPGAKITVDKDAAGPPAGAPISVELSGDDYFQLMEVAEHIKGYIGDANIGGIEELKLDVEQGKPELPIIVDRDKARRLGLSTYSIGDAIRTALFGAEVSTYKEGEDDYPIQVRMKKEARENPDNLLNQRITFRDMASGQIVQVPISSVANAEKTSTFSAVKRADMNRIITITSNVTEGYNATEINNQIKQLMAQYELPEGVSVDYTGEQEQQAEEMAFLSTALAIAFFLIIVIIVAQFNSISTPFIIGFSVFFSLTGVFLGLILFQMDFVILMTMIGIISLAGIVVNNAIVLIDYTNLLISREEEKLGLGDGERLPIEGVKKAIEDAGKTRLRPVLLTAITTILGLIPLAVGLNIDFFSFFTTLNPNVYVGGDNVAFWGPMSWTIIFGLTFATFLTLVIVPVMYYLLKRLKYRIFR